MFLCGQLLAITGYAFAPRETWTAVLWQTLVGWGSAAFVEVGVRRMGPGRGAQAWRAFAIGIFCNAGGILVEGIRTRIFHVSTYPSISDAVFLAIFPCLVFGLAVIIRHRSPVRDWSSVVDTTIITVGVGLFSWVFFVRPPTENLQVTLINRLTVAAYPVGDVIVLGMITRLFIGGGSRQTSFLLMFAALLCFLGSDIGWAMVGSAGTQTGPVLSHLFEMNTLLAFTLVGAAALHPSARNVAQKVPVRPANLSRLMLVNLSLASLGGPGLLAFEALRHDIRDGFAIAVSSTLLFVLVVIRMAQLLKRLEERTGELDRRNLSFRQVLDTITEGLLRVSHDGTLAQERSAAVERWFGPVPAQTKMADYLARSDLEFARRFEQAHEALVEGIFPLEVHLAQMPTRMRANGRQFRIGYLPIADGSAQDGGLLVVISDETDGLVLARRQAEQAELLSLFRRVTRDRAGLSAFLDEARGMVTRAVADVADLDLRRRLIHTLKGNASMMGLSVVAELCHEVEDQMNGDSGAGLATAIQTLAEHWRTIDAAADELLGARGANVVEVSSQEIDEVCEEIQRGVPLASIVRRLSEWRCEQVERPLRRLGDHAQALCKKLRKGDPVVEIVAGPLRLDPRRWGPLWVELVHVVNNAVDHGFEPATERQLAGKPVQPRLRLAAFMETRHFVIEISDDGRGIDWSAVKHAASARGLPTEGEGDLVAALFSSGVTTRDEVSLVSGRGLGMAAVQERLRELRGEVQVSSTWGVGTTWRFVFPLSQLLPHERMDAAGSSRARLEPV